MPDYRKMYLTLFDAVERNIIRNCVGAGDSARPPVEYHPSAVST